MDAVDSVRRTGPSKVLAMSLGLAAVVAQTAALAPPAVAASCPALTVALGPPAGDRLSLRLSLPESLVDRPLPDRAVSVRQGQRRIRVLSLRRVPASRVDVALVIGGLGEDRAAWDQARRTAEEVVRSLPKQVRVGVVLPGTKPPAAPTADRRITADLLQEARPGTGQDVYGAMLVALDQLGRSPDRYRHLVVVTGGGLPTSAEAETVRTALFTSRATLAVASVGPRKGSPADGRCPGEFDAGATAGRAISERIASEQRLIAPWPSNLRLSGVQVRIQTNSPPVDARGTLQLTPRPLPLDPQGGSDGSRVDVRTLLVGLGAGLAAIGLLILLTSGLLQLRRRAGGAWRAARLRSRVRVPRLHGASLTRARGTSAGRGTASRTFGDALRQSGFSTSPTLVPSSEVGPQASVVDLTTYERHADAVRSPPAVSQQTETAPAVPWDRARLDLALSRQQSRESQRELIQEVELRDAVSARRAAEAAAESAARLLAREQAAAAEAARSAARDLEALDRAVEQRTAAELEQAATGADRAAAERAAREAARQLDAERHATAEASRLLAEQRRALEEAAEEAAGLLARQRAALDEATSRVATEEEALREIEQRRDKAERELALARERTRAAEDEVVAFETARDTRPAKADGGKGPQAPARRPTRSKGRKAAKPAATTARRGPKAVAVPADDEPELGATAAQLPRLPVPVSPRMAWGLDTVRATVGMLTRNREVASVAGWLTADRDELARQRRGLHGEATTVRCCLVSLFPVAVVARATIDPGWLPGLTTITGAVTALAAVGLAGLGSFWLFRVTKPPYSLRRTAWGPRWLTDKRSALAAGELAVRLAAGTPPAEAGPRVAAAHQVPLDLLADLRSPADAAIAAHSLGQHIETTPPAPFAALALAPFVTCLVPAALLMLLG